MGDTVGGESIRRADNAELDRSRDALIDEMALPFLDLAEKFEAAKLNGADPQTWKALFETNLFLWKFISNFLPRHFDEDVTKETRDLLGRISKFMIKVSVAIEDEPEKDGTLIDTLVKMNLNMCDQILAMRRPDPE